MWADLLMGICHMGTHTGKDQDFVHVIQIIFFLSVLWGEMDNNFHFHYYFFFEGGVEVHKD